MNTFSMVQRALNASAADVTKAGLDATVIETGRIVQAVQTVVDALTPPDGGRYIVGFADISTAATSLGERRIIVSRRPLFDASLSLVEKAVVIATFAAHEIGHTFVTRPRSALIQSHNRHSGYHAVANLADDIILEPWMVERFPILEDAFEFTGLWVLRSTAKDPLPKVRKLTKGMTTPERFNVLLDATRYGDIPEIVWADGATTRERDWSRDWARDLIAIKLADHDGFLALCDEAWVRIRSEADTEEPPVEEPPGPVCGPVGPVGPKGEEPEDDDEDGEDEGPGPSEDPNDRVDDWDDDKGEPEDGESEESDEDEDGESDEDGDEESEDESEGTDDSGESEEFGDESDATGKDDDADSQNEEFGDPNAPKGDDVTPGGGGAADAIREENDFNKDEIDESTHSQYEAEPYDWEAKNIDERARIYSSTTVTAFGKHGALQTRWD